VTLAGIDSVMRPRQDRIDAWARLVTDLDQDKLALITHEIGLSEVIETAQRLMDGGVRGRVVVDTQR
jgi:acrylyl-CoA reductase (NADPH)